MNVNHLNSPDFTGKKILIAEDDEVNFLLIEIILKSTGATVYHAWNGIQVLDFIKIHKDISIVLMDIKMPVMNGFDATKEVKKLIPEMIIIAQTAYVLGDDKYKCFEAGCTDYISKPINKEKLFNVLKKYLSN